MIVPLALATVSHHEADIARLEAIRFPDEPAFLVAARERFHGAVLLQTCNRVEVLVQGDAKDLAAYLAEQGRDGFWIMEGKEVLRHLLELASGLDSMIVGEDQILGQLRQALTTSQECGTCSKILELCINKAVHVGSRVRQCTGINRGALSIGSAAVELAEEILGGLADRHILVVGSGEIGSLVAQALAAKKLTALYVTNRTYERAATLAKKIGGRAVNFRDLYHYITLSDVVISCTAAPHPVIHAGPLREAMQGVRWPLDHHPRPLILIDIAQPRDIEEEVGRIAGIHLFSIDNLRTVSENNLANRKMEAEKARAYIESELDHFILLLRRTASDDTIAHLYTWAESIRTRERDRALTRLGAGEDERAREVLDDLTRVLTKKLLSDATLSIRTSAEQGDMQAADSLVRAITRGEKLCFRKEE